MINVCIPYIPSKWGDGEELRYALRSWDENFQEDFTVWVIGDLKNKPKWLSEKCWLHIPDTIGKWREYNQGKHLDRLTQMFDSFFYTNDDIFILQASCLRMLQAFHYLCDDLRNLPSTMKAAEIEKNLMREYKQFYADNNAVTSLPKWELFLIATINFLRSLGRGADIFPLYNWETHLPYYYESDKLRRVADLIPIFQGYALAHTAYCNVFLRDKPRYKLTYSTKAAFYHDVDMNLTDEEIRQRIHRARFMNFDDRIIMMKPVLKDFLMETFTEPSRWEIDG